MKQRLFIFLRLATLFVAIFTLCKGAFLLYNLGEEPIRLTDAMEVWLHGLSMDLSTTGYLLVLPWLTLLLTFFWPRLPLRRLLTPYFIIVASLLAAILVGDTVMYPFWKFKLDNTVFAYLSDTQGATNSVSHAFILSCFLAFAVLAAVIALSAIQLTPRQLPAQTCKPLKRAVHGLLWLLPGGFTFLFIRGGWQESTMNVGVAYYSQRLYLNHAAVNPAFNMMYSISKNKDFSKQFQTLREEERQAAFQGLYEKGDTTLTDTLLHTRRPNILCILLEGMGAQFIEEMGGLKDVTPELSRFIPQGVLFEQMYANSFRTDRGVVSTFSGWLSYPSVSLMRIPGHSATLPSLARSLRNVGYSTQYIYGGDINFTGTSGYLIATGYERLVSDKHFSLKDVNESKWGANDSVTGQRALQEAQRLQKTGKPWFLTWQTLSSHEPFEVPYKRLKEKIPNAFAFTDHCVGQLVDSLRTQPDLWNNLLIIVLPDHGSTYQSSYENPDFFHTPLLWLGGSLRQARRIPTLMNQSDMAATLLGQLGISSADFPWSRNILSRGYRYPFAYSTYAGGVLLRDSTGITLYDINSRTTILDRPSESPIRLKRIKAILQTSYQQLGKRK